MALIFSLLAFLASASLPKDKASTVPRHVSQLHDWLAAKTDPKVGVLSQANYDSVHHLLPSTVEPMIFSHKDDLLQHTRNGSVHASVMSSLPADSSGLVMFSSTLVSPRGMFTAEPADTLRFAIDAAIVRALHDNVDSKAAAKNQPFEYVAVHTCKTNQVNLFPFPDPAQGDRLQKAIERGYLRVAALGPKGVTRAGPGSNWGPAGDYSAVPPTGFYPEFLDAVEAAFRANYSVDFQRVWADSSPGVMDLLLNDEADTTEPYMTIDAFHAGRSRTHSFIFSCTTLGTDSTFLVADTDLQSELNREAKLASEVEELKLELAALRGETGVTAGAASAFVLAGVALVAPL
jgi:hypothetical protein